MGTRDCYRCHKLGKSIVFNLAVRVTTVDARCMRECRRKRIEAVVERQRVLAKGDNDLLLLQAVADHVDDAAHNATAIDALRDKLLAPERLAAMLAAFAERRSQRANAINDRLFGLQQEADEAREKLDRLYRLIEDGAEPDIVLNAHIATLRTNYDRANAALERGQVQAGSDVVIDPAMITDFSTLMTGILASLSSIPCAGHGCDHCSQG